MSASTVRIGLDAKIYRNTGTYGSPVWNLIEHVRNQAMSLEGEEVDASDNDSAWELVEMGHAKLEVEFDIRYDTADDDWAALVTAFLDRNNHVEFAVMDGDITESGEKGWRITGRVLQASESKQKGEPYNLACKFKPAANTDGNPQQYTVP